MYLTCAFGSGEILIPHLRLPLRWAKHNATDVECHGSYRGSYFSLFASLTLKKYKCMFFVMLPEWVINIHRSLIMSRGPVESTSRHMRPSNTLIRLRIRTVRSESSMCALCVAKGSTFVQAKNWDSAQTVWINRLIGIFAGRTRQLVHVHYTGYRLIYYNC